MKGATRRSPGQARGIGLPSNQKHQGTGLLECISHCKEQVLTTAKQARKTSQGKRTNQLTRPVGAAGLVVWLGGKLHCEE